MSAALLALVMCFAGVFCLTPLAIYLLWLTGVNKRTRPTVVAGSWDFIALVAGLSGFMLFGGLIMLTTLQSNFRYWTRGNFEQLREAWGQEKFAWLTIALLYVTVVILAVVFTAIRKRRTLTVYAVELESLLETVDGEVKGVVPTAQRMGYTWAGQVEIVPFVGMGHAEVNVLTADPNQASELDLRLRRAIPDALPAPVTPAAWLSTAALGCSIGAICSLGLVMLYMFFLNR